MSKFNIAEAKARLSELVQRTLLGEEVVIAKDNKPLLKLCRCSHKPRSGGNGHGD